MKTSLNCYILLSLKVNYTKIKRLEKNLFNGFSALYSINYFISYYFIRYIFILKPKATVKEFINNSFKVKNDDLGLKFYI